MLSTFKNRLESKRVRAETESNGEREETFPAEHVHPAIYLRPSIDEESPEFLDTDGTS